MKLFIDFWWGIGFGFEIWRQRFETRTFGYFFGRIWFSKHQLTIDLYRHEGHGFLFHIGLPFFSLNNDMVQEAVSTGGDPQYKIKSVVTGKLFGKIIDWRHMTSQNGNGGWFGEQDNNGNTF